MSLTNCTKCGKEISDMATVCIHCGYSSILKTKEYNIINWRAWGIIAAIISILPLGIGFYKMFVYDNGEFINDAVNAYVGGDAYNYIINANYATGFFVIAGILIIVAIGCGIFEYLQEIMINTYNSTKNMEKIQEIK